MRRGLVEIGGGLPTFGRRGGNGESTVRWSGESLALVQPIVVYPLLQVLRVRFLCFFPRRALFLPSSTPGTRQSTLLPTMCVT